MRQTQDTSTSRRATDEASQRIHVTNPDKTESGNRRPLTTRKTPSVAIRLPRRAQLYGAGATLKLPLLHPLLPLRGQAQAPMVNAEVLMSAGKPSVVFSIRATDEPPSLSDSRF